MTRSSPISAVLHRSWALDLDVTTLYALLRLRIEVFVVEQACPYPELDGRDLQVSTRHFWLRAEPGTEVQACLRLLEDPDGVFRIGRLCTARASRGRGLGRRLVEAGLAEVGDSRCVLDSQSHLAGFYRSLGFQVVGDEFVEDGIPHVPMARQR
jgi:ElaA protein